MRLRNYASLFGLLFCTAVYGADEDNRQELRDLFYGEALFHAYQDEHFSAITRLDTELGQYYGLDEPELDPFHYHIKQAEFSVGDLELSYRMHRQAGRAIKAVLEGDVRPSVRNEAAYRLAKIYMQKNEPVNALHIMQSMTEEIPERIQVDEAYLRSQVYLATGKFAEAVNLLQELQDEDSLEGFAAYNLGIALIQNGQEKEGIMQLEKVGTLASNDPAVLAIRDKANLTLGYRMLENGAPQFAANYLERVRLDGPFSNRALLGAGWVKVSLGQFDKALVPWTLLHKRSVTDTSVQEVMLAVPYAYGRLDVYGKAAVMYGHAMDVFGREVDSLDASIRSIREGKFLQAVLREESKQDPNWLINLRDLPETPETRYLMELMASHDFQELLKNYFDLADLRAGLGSWLQSLDVYEEIIGIRRAYYTPLLPVVEKEFKTLDTRIKLRLEQRDRLEQRLKGMLISRRPEYLATAEERAAVDILGKLRTWLDAHPRNKTDENMARIKRLQGVLHWRVNTEYDARLTEAYENLRLLDTHIDKLNQVYKSFIRTRQAATQSYEGYTIPIQQLRTRLQQAQQKLNAVMARQGRMLETLAINELDRRRQRLEEYQVKARFAMAESYDRATKKQQQELETQ
ncbi:MAG: tetratricopeptide repeat protein [Gammaproteobacteria bacterium]|nr:MAG: tetratricopeptide repeat protein [Gammaproteobacteria bacterium]